MKTLMKHYLTAPAVFSIAMAGALASFDSRADASGWKKGRYLPDIAYVNAGEKTSLHAQRGKVVFVNFWASWCPYCAKEWKHIQDAYEKFGADGGVEFVLLNLFEPHSAAVRFVSKRGYTAPVSDPLYRGDASAKKRYKSALKTAAGKSIDYAPKWIPVSFLLNADGKIIKRFSGGTRKGEVQKAIAKALRSV